MPVVVTSKLPIQGLVLMTPSESPIGGIQELKMPHSINNMLNHHERQLAVSERKFSHAVIYNTSKEDITILANATVGKCCFILQETNKLSIFKRNVVHESRIDV